VNRTISRLFIASLVVVLLAGSPGLALAQNATPTAADVEIVADGLTNPRGFAWGPDGAIYIALAGNGGDNQVSVGGTPYPYFGGTSSSIVKLEGGCLETVAEGLPSGLWTEPNWVWGIMDVVFFNDELYALSGGGGESWGNPEVPNGVYRVNADGSTELVANLSEWLAANPTSFIPPDYDPGGSLFDMEAGPDALYVSEAVGGRVIEVMLDGTINLIADLSEGHLVPTGIALDGDGNIYVGHETTIPYPDGASKVIMIAPDGTVSDAWTNLTMVTDVVIGPEGALYAAEMSTGNTDDEPYIHNDTGRIVRQTGPDSSEVVVEGIDYPVMMGFGADGALYFDGPAFGANDGEGWLARLSSGGMTGATPVGYC
jgi:hypothetical protein